MKVASRVMYSIANFFNWIVVLTCIAGIVVLPMVMCGVIKNTTQYTNSQLLATVIYLAITLFFTFIVISMVRIAKHRGSSKGWDFLFVILGILSMNIFYVLGGIFGLFAAR